MNDYKSIFEECVTSMLEALKLPILQQRRLETRLVMLYKVVRGMVPAINADEFLIPIYKTTFTTNEPWHEIFNNVAFRYV